NLVTTINSVNNGYNAVLAVNASTTVSNAAATVSGGWGGGPYNGVGPSKLWLNPYMESNQPPSKMTFGSTVIGGSGLGGSPGFDRTYGEPLIFLGGSTGEIYPSNGGVKFNRVADFTLSLGLQAGSTVDKDEQIFFQNH